ncbi:MAG: polysaccharide deacetylase family protein [Candidatus Pacearchaeota archaeon]
MKLKKLIYSGLFLFFLQLNLYAEPQHIVRGPKDKKQIALTFDDGDNLESVIKVLEEKNVKATFFLTGNYIMKRKEEVKRAYEKGHEIENHTYTHPNCTNISLDSLINEVVITDSEIYNITGYIPRFFRFPYGKANNEKLETIEKLGKKSIFWTIDTRDWEYKKEEYKKARENIIKMINEQTNNEKGSGSIILMHTKTIVGSYKILPEIIDLLKSKGYELVTINEMFEK